VSQKCNWVVGLSHQGLPIERPPSHFPTLLSGESGGRRRGCKALLLSGTAWILNPVLLKPPFPLLLLKGTPPLFWNVALLHAQRQGAHRLPGSPSATLLPHRPGPTMLRSDHSHGLRPGPSRCGVWAYSRDSKSREMFCQPPPDPRPSGKVHSHSHCSQGWDERAQQVPGS
jgi:hypothetical protein